MAETNIGLPKNVTFNLSETELDEIGSKVGLEMARVGIYFSIIKQSNSMHLRLHNPITLYDTLDALAFQQECLFVTRGLILASYTYNEVLRGLGKLNPSTPDKRDSQS